MAENTAEPKVEHVVYCPACKKTLPYAAGYISTRRVQMADESGISLHAACATEAGDLTKFQGAALPELKFAFRFDLTNVYEIPKARE